MELNEHPVIASSCMECIAIDGWTDCSHLKGAQSVAEMMVERQRVQLVFFELAVMDLLTPWHGFQPVVVAPVGASNVLVSLVSALSGTSRL
jgi:hypothetical protein